MTAVDAAVERLTAAVPYLRVSAGDPPPGREWFDCAALTTDAGALSALVATTKAGRGTDRGDVAVSLFVQAHAFRIASLAVGAWVIGDVVVDVSAANTSIAIGRDRPDSVHLDRLQSVGSGLEALHATLVDDHLAPLVETAHRACLVGERLLWSNVGASIASAFAMTGDALADERAAIRGCLERFVAMADPELGRSGRVVRLGGTWAWERAACCLYHLCATGSRCEDCSLWTAEERRARYDRVLAAEEAGA